MQTYLGNPPVPQGGEQGGPKSPPKLPKDAPPASPPAPPPQLTRPEMFNAVLWVSIVALYNAEYELEKADYWASYYSDLLNDPDYEGEDRDELQEGLNYWANEWFSALMGLAAVESEVGTAMDALVNGPQK